jgi:hypothetical protein
LVTLAQSSEFCPHPATHRKGAAAEEGEKPSRIRQQRFLSHGERLIAISHHCMK